MYCFIVYRYVFIYVCEYISPMIPPPRISRYDILDLFSPFTLCSFIFYFTILELYCIYRLTCFKKSCCKHCFVSSKFSVNLCLMTIYYTIIWLHQFINFSTVVGYLDCFWCSIIINYPIISIYTHFFFFFCLSSHFL